MKLISLNVWGGKIYRPLMNFINEQAETTDIFCFQEVFQSDSGIPKSSGYRTNIYNDIAYVLKDFDGYFAKTFDGYDMVKIVDFDLRFGVAMFVKKYINVVSHEETLIHHVAGGVIKRKDYFETSRSIQSIRFNSNNKIFNIYSLHGLWILDAYGGKRDNKERMQQSKRIRQFMNKNDGEKIVVGDFNLDPDTESLKLLEKNLKNLIKDYSIKTTRSSLYTRENKFADYTLASLGIRIIDFQVPNVAVSDHLPMILKFS
jgi:exonuclease III